MNWTIFTAIFTAITAIATFVAAGIALWIACTEQWRQEKYRQKILNSQKYDLILVPTREYSAGTQYQTLRNELYGLGKLQQTTTMNKYFQQPVTVISPSELYWLNSECIYGVNIKPDILVSEIKTQFERKQYFKEVFVTDQGKKHDEQKMNIKKEIKMDKKENKLPVTKSACMLPRNEQMNVKWAEIGNGLGGLATATTVILSLYSFLILFGFEIKLRKYNLTVANTQILPSIFLFGILGVIVVILSGVFFGLLYYTVKNIVWKIFVLYLSYVVTFAYFFSWQISINNSYNTWTLYDVIGSLGRITRFAQPMLMHFGLGMMWCYAWYKIVENKKVPITIASYCYRICAICVVLSIMVFVNSDINPNHLKTVHIPNTEIKKTYTENILHTNNGEEIWAIICETANYYYIEPIVIKDLTSADKEYGIDIDYSMAIEKANIIVYTETVREVVKEAYEHDIKTSQ